jgi:hypothetical protein
MDSGYSLDFISDRQIGASAVAAGRIVPAAKAAPYQTLIIPACRFVPVETVERVLLLAGKGATVIFQKLPSDVPGLRDVEARKAKLVSLTANLPFKEVAPGVRSAAYGSGKVVLAGDVSAALAYVKIDREQLADAGLKFIRRKAGAATWYYLVNHTAKDIDQEIMLNAAGNALLLDPLTGRFGKAKSSIKNGRTSVRVQLPAGQAVFVKIDPRVATAPAWAYLGTVKESQTVNPAATLSFTSGGPALPKAQQLTRLVSWTELGDPDAAKFSGSGVYTFTFNLPAKGGGEYVLDLGDVRESARVQVNGKDAGILWSVPYQARIGSFLKPGRNTITVEVANLMANRIRDLDQRKVEWRKYNEINFVNLNYQSFDASNWELQPSGLLGPVRIINYNLN